MSIDGGGIRGIFPAVVLAEFERRYLDGASAMSCFDMIAGTSTGGIIALGLSAGLTADQIATFYLERGNVIFPPPKDHGWGAWVGRWEWLRSLVKFRYDREPIRGLLGEVLGDRTLAQAGNRLCIPSFEGTHGDVYIYKTPHHPDFYLDGPKAMTTVAMATSAAPTYFQPLAEQNHLLIDGGIWANNPIMIAVVDALSCFNLAHVQVEVLSLGCGDDPYSFRPARVRHGGVIPWLDLIFTVMRLQSLNALGQSRLLLGAPNVVRLDTPPLDPPISLDNWKAARDRLPSLAVSAAQNAMADVSRFFASPVDPWEPLTRTPLPAAEG
ncbi:MAG: CBASS cGAMP-activated phospholipase [Panacagrimonas sp.]